MRFYTSSSSWRRVTLFARYIPFSVSVEILGRGFGFSVRRRS